MKVPSPGERSWCGRPDSGTDVESEKDIGGGDMAVELLDERGMMFRTGTQYHPPLAIPPFTLTSAVVQKGSYEAASLIVGDADWVGRVQGKAVPGVSTQGGQRTQNSSQE